MAVTVNNDTCTACGICADVCPTDVFDMEDVAIVARGADCTECGICVDDCPNGSITL